MNRDRERGGQIRSRNVQKAFWSSVCRVKNQHKLKSPVTCVLTGENRLYPPSATYDFSVVYRIFQIGHSMRKERGKFFETHEKDLEENFSGIRRFLFFLK